jgi:alanyl-tRNA synthetase
MLKTKPSELVDKIQTQIDEIKSLKRVIDNFKAKETSGEVDRFLYGAKKIGDLHVLTAMIPNADAGKLRQTGDLLRDKDADIVAVLTSVNEGKITFLAVCGKNAVAKGVRAGDLVKLVCTACGGSGGGKPDSAMGGGKDESKIDDALALVDNFVLSKLG